MDASEVRSIIETARLQQQKDLRDLVPDRRRLDQIDESQNALLQRVLDLEQKTALGARGPGDASPAAALSSGALFCKSADLESYRRLGTTGRVAVPLLSAKNILDSTMAPSVIVLPPSLIPIRAPRVADYLTRRPTTAGSAQYAQETAFVNNAAVVPEKAQKPESNKTFTIVTASAVLIAHWIQCSTQIADDQPGLIQQVDNQLINGLLLRLEDWILNSTGGLIDVAHAMADPAASTSQPDVIAAAISYLIAAGYNPSFITLNPADWLATTLLKADTAGTYLLSGAVQSAVRPQLWGLPVVQSPSIAAGTFLVGDGNCAVLLDREQATIEMSREDRDNFIKNLITILAERRVILTVPLPAGFATGNLAAP